MRGIERKYAKTSGLVDEYGNTTFRGERSNLTTRVDQARGTVTFSDGYRNRQAKLGSDGNWRVNGKPVGPDDEETLNSIWKRSQRLNYQTPHQPKSTCTLI